MKAGGVAAKSDAVALPKTKALVESLLGGK